METRKLYYDDPYLQAFTATVTACEPIIDAWRAALDRTAFYPEGGGQPADHGALDGVRVTDVHERDGVIWHTVDAPLPVGGAVIGRLDWERRFDHMQQHSGEHIISGILCHDYHCDNVGFHLGAEAVTIDYNAEISWEQALDAERKANEIIWADAPVEVQYPSPEALKTMDYRSKKELTGQVRIVTFPNADCCACCGTHVLRAGQVGLIKVLSCQKFREGARIEIVCGKRALALVSAAWEQAVAVGQRLSVKPLEIAGAVERVEEELSSVKLHAAELEGEAFAAIAREHAGAGDVVLLRPPMKPDSVRRLADAVAHTCGGLAAVFAGEDGGKYNYALVRAGGGDIAALVKELNQSLHGRGGGRNGFAQGSVEAKHEEIEAFFKR